MAGVDARAFCVYIHRRASDLQPFYVGKGRERRPSERSHRNPHWRNVVAKHGLIVEIVQWFDCEREAFSHERFLICGFRAVGARLTNRTDGGEGVSGHKHTAKTRNYLRDLFKGRQISDETRAKMSASRTGKRRSEEAKEKMRRPCSEATKAKLRKPKSESARRRMGDASRRALGRSVECTTTGERFPSMTHAVAWLHSAGHDKARKSAITAACRGRVATAYGRCWKYSEQPTDGKNDERT